RRGFSPSTWGRTLRSAKITSWKTSLCRWKTDPMKTKPVVAVIALFLCACMARPGYGADSGSESKGNASTSTAQNRKQAYLDFAHKLENDMSRARGKAFSAAFDVELFL